MMEAISNFMGLFKEVPCPFCREHISNWTDIAKTIHFLSKHPLKYVPLKRAAVKAMTESTWDGLAPMKLGYLPECNEPVHRKVKREMIANQQPYSPTLPSMKAKNAIDMEAFGTATQWSGSDNDSLSDLAEDSGLPAYNKKPCMDSCITLEL